MYVDIHLKNMGKMQNKDRVYKLKSKGETQLLKMVKDDYTKYENAMVQQKKVQNQTMGVLENYVNDIPNDLREQQKLLYEISNIRKRMDELIKN